MYASDAKKRSEEPTPGYKTRKANTFANSYVETA